MATSKPSKPPSKKKIPWRQRRPPSISNGIGIPSKSKAFRRPKPTKGRMLKYVDLQKSGPDSIVIVTEEIICDIMMHSGTLGDAVNDVLSLHDKDQKEYLRYTIYVPVMFMEENKRVIINWLNLEIGKRMIDWQILSNDTICWNTKKDKLIQSIIFKDEPAMQVRFKCEESAMGFRLFWL